MGRVPVAERPLLAPSVADPHGRHAVWSRIHGHVALEIGGNFASMGLDPDALFEAEVDALVA